MLPENVKEEIQQAYRDVLSGKGIRARLGQRQMIAAIARYLGNITHDDGERTSPPSVSVIEAGTGTGKTLAYLLAMIPLARHLNKKLVIATATVALQDQIVGRELPELRRHSALDFEWTLAKGRGRYLCLAKLERRLHEEGNTDSDTMSLPFLEDDGAISGVERAFFEQLLAAYANQSWDGDRDHWPEGIPDDLWRQLTTDHRQCTNRHCSYFDSCAFFSARQSQESVDIIVANHDLVLADLALGGGAVLPRPEEALYVFDEAHHLPDKALSHFAASLQLQATRQWLKQMSQLMARLLPFLPPGSATARILDRVSTSSREYDAALEAIYGYLEEETEWQSDDGRGGELFRYPGGELPERLAALAEPLQVDSAGLLRHLGTLNEELQKGFDERRESDVDRATAEAWLPAIGTLMARAEAGDRLWRSYARLSENVSASRAPIARWVQRIDRDGYQDISLFSSPVLADDLLFSRLWSRAFGVVLTSATLTALGRFDRLTQRAGLPQASEFAVVPSAFRYPEMATLEVPGQALEPMEGEAYSEALAKCLPEVWQGERAILVLFTSRRQMEAIYERLSPEFPDTIVTQDQMGKAAVLAHHRERVDAGKTSILFGLASFAEGIDLPGEYLEQVVITRLPFSVPNDPIEASLAEWISARGGNPFMEISVPDAAIRLVQAAGRLLRSESDRGRVTILDRRVVTRRYGALLLDALPPFRRVIQA